MLVCLYALRGFTRPSYISTPDSCKKRHLRACVPVRFARVHTPKLHLRGGGGVVRVWPLRRFYGLYVYSTGLSVPQERDAAITMGDSELQAPKAFRRAFHAPELFISALRVGLKGYVVV